MAGLDIAGGCNNNGFMGLTSELHTAPCRLDVGIEVLELCVGETIGAGAGAGAGLALMSDEVRVTLSLAGGMGSTLERAESSPESGTLVLVAAGMLGCS